MRPALSRLLVAGATASLALSVLGPPAGARGGDHPAPPPLHLRTVVDGLDGPRGVDALGHGLTLVTESDGTFSLVIEKRRHRGPTRTRVVELGQVTSSIAPAIALGRGRTVWLLTTIDDPSTTEDDETAARLFKWRPWYDAPREVADIGAYQASDPDPADLESNPTESNPFGLAALRDGTVLVADAAGNDLLRVRRGGRITTVARLLPRTVTVPPGLPGAGSEVPSEAVATSVTVGRDGAWYVGELRGFPATPGTSQVWRVERGSVGATCDPEAPDTGACTRYADGLTSIMDLATGKHGVYAASLSKLGWLAIEAEEPPPGADIGAVHLITRRGATPREIKPGAFRLPGGIDAAGSLYVTSPLFGPGTLQAVGHSHRHSHGHSPRRSGSAGGAWRSWVR